MEELFFGFRNFFDQAGGQRQGRRNNPPQHRNKIRKQIARLEGPPAQKHKIDCRAPQHGQHQIDPHLTVSGGQGIEEQGRRDHQPKEQIQQAAQRLEGDAHPQHPKGVIEQPHRRPQQQRPGQIEGLTGQRDLHISGRAGPAGRRLPPAGRPHR